MGDAPDDLEKLVQAALSEVKEPSGRNILQAGLVTQISGAQGMLMVRCLDYGWPQPIKDRLVRDIGAALKSKIASLSGVNVEWQPPNSAPAGGHGDHGHAHDHGHSHGHMGTPAHAMETPKLAIKHVVAVGSGKGGVGKSTIAAALAYAMRLRGESVGLMDADVYGPSIPHMLGVKTPPRVENNRYIPPAVDGIKVISMGSLIPANQAVVWRGPMLHKAVRDFLFSVEWGPLDYLFVDLPPGTGDVVLSLSQQMPLAGGVIVCTPQDVALLDAKKAFNMFETVKIPCRGVVENMSVFACPSCGAKTEIFGHGGARRWAEEIGVPFLGEVPINLSIRLHGDSGKMRDNFEPNSPVLEYLVAIAENLEASLRASPMPEAPAIEIVN